jgi:peroxiredoxin
MKHKFKIFYTIIFTAIFLITNIVKADGLVGDEAEDFEIKTLDGKVVQLSDYKGKTPVLLVFWATWCPNCLREIPQINKLNAGLVAKGKKFAILGINVGISETLDKVKSYHKKHNMKYPVAYDEDNFVTSSFSVTATPTQIIIGVDGKIKYRADETPKFEEIIKNWDALTKK